MVAKTVDSKKFEWGWMNSQRRAVVEASEIGLAVGEFPQMLEPTPLVGNGLNFFALKRLADGGVRYKQDFGMAVIDVLND